MWNKIYVGIDWKLSHTLLSSKPKLYKGVKALVSKCTNTKTLAYI